VLSAEADALCGVGLGECSGESVNCRKGYRERPFDKRAGTIPLPSTT
jgi:transposase-like protein